LTVLLSTQIIIKKNNKIKNYFLKNYYSVNLLIIIKKWEKQLDAVLVNENNRTYFKSFVSTNFTTRAFQFFIFILANTYNSTLYLTQVLLVCDFGHPRGANGSQKSHIFRRGIYPIWY